LAQEWSKEDSIWLQKVLEGKEELIINEATKKAIEEGRLIAPSRMKETDLDLNKDFDNTGVPDDSRIRGIDPYSMPPAVFALYVLYMEKMDSIYQIKSLIITADERKMLESLLPTGTLQSFYFNTKGYMPGFGRVHDFNHMLSMVFSSHYRQLYRNSKNATAYKNYNDAGFTRPFRITEHERKQLNKSVNSKRPSIVVSHGRRGGIDD
jgi:hypothetical protein